MGSVYLLLFINNFILFLISSQHFNITMKAFIILAVAAIGSAAPAADPQLLQSGLPAGPLTPAWGDLVATSSNLCWTSICSCLRSCPSTCICPLSCTHSSYSYLHRTNHSHRNCTSRYPCCYQRPSPCLWRWILRRIPWRTPSCSCCQAR